jgi:tetratricopeptide (TPR) repeat protein
LEKKLTQRETLKVEDHIKGCLFCLNQLSELRELIHFEKYKEPLPLSLEERLINSLPQATTPSKDLFSTIKNTILSPTKGWGKTFIPKITWKYAFGTFLSLLVVCSTTVYLTLQFIKPEKTFTTQNTIPDEIVRKAQKAAVKVNVIDKKGKILREVPGFVLDSSGLILTNLSDLNNANSAKIDFNDGSTYQAESVVPDFEKNLALIKVNKENLPALKLSETRAVEIGNKVIKFTGPNDPEGGFSKAVVTKNIPLSTRRGEGKSPYIQLASTTSTNSKGVLLNEAGKVIGMTIQQEEKNSIAIILSESDKIEGNFKPLSEIGQVKNKGEAINMYLKGVLSDNEEKYDEAIKYFKSSIELDNNFEAAHLELGYLYYYKKMYDLEVKEYQEALRINPKNTLARFNLAGSYDQAGLYDKAIKEFEIILQIDPKDKETLYELGVSNVSQGKIEKARANYEALKFLDPGHAGKLKALIDIAENSDAGT